MSKNDENAKAREQIKRLEAELAELKANLERAKHEVLSADLDPLAKADLVLQFERQHKQQTRCSRSLISKMRQLFPGALH